MNETQTKYRLRQDGRTWTRTGGPSLYHAIRDDGQEVWPLSREEFDAVFEPIPAEPPDAPRDCTGRAYSEGCMMVNPVTGNLYEFAEEGPTCRRKIGCGVYEPGDVNHSLRLDNCRIIWPLPTEEARDA